MLRNLRLYQIYSVLFSAMFWLPVFAIYIIGRVGLEGLLQLEAIYYMSVVLLEVPSGYFSDRIGRRPTLAISTLALSLAALLFMLGNGFGVFCLAQILTAVGFAFNSGSDISLHYDSLKAQGDEDSFARLEAVAERNRFLASGLAAVIGGSVAIFDLRLAYLLGALLNFANLFIVLAMHEPASHGPRVSFGNALRYCLQRLRTPALGWLAGFFLLMTVLNHIPYEFYQPYLSLLAIEGLYPEPYTTLVSGLIMGASMLAGSWFAANSIRMRDRIGIGATLLLACALQALIIGVMGSLLHAAVILLILLRSVPRGMMMPAFNAAVTPRVDQQHRATYLSVMSLGGRLAFSLTLLVLSFFAGEAQDWTSLSHLLLIGAGIGIVGLAMLAATLKRARPGAVGTAAGS